MAFSIVFLGCRIKNGPIIIMSTRIMIFANFFAFAQNCKIGLKLDLPDYFYQLKSHFAQVLYFLSFF